MEGRDGKKEHSKTKISGSEETEPKKQIIVDELSPASEFQQSSHDLHASSNTQGQQHDQNSSERKFHLCFEPESPLTAKRENNISYHVENNSNAEIQMINLPQ